MRINAIASNTRSIFPKGFAGAAIGRLVLLLRAQYRSVWSFRAQRFDWAVAISTVLLGVFLAPSGVAAHELEHSLFDCGCSDICFTDEVSDVHCTENERRFSSTGLPAKAHPRMTGIKATNQQFPILHNYSYRLPLTPEFTGAATPTVPGAIGVAVNGVPLFDPSTQGPPLAETGRPISAYDAGELDDCGGHAGRGDDYHYHIAPRCLIEELGEVAVEDRRQPIGFAADGFAILALGWFRPENNIEAVLDDCRGARDSQGQYFYNVSNLPPFAILECINGAMERGFSTDVWEERRDADGDAIVGIPIRFQIADYQSPANDGAACHVMSGTLRDERVAMTRDQVKNVDTVDGSIFYCHERCYGQFLDRWDWFGMRQRTIYFDRQLLDCPDGLQALSNNAFLEFADE